MPDKKKSKNKLPYPEGRGIPPGKFVSDKVPTSSGHRFIPPTKRRGGVFAFVENKKNQKEISAARMIFWTLVKVFIIALVVVVIPAFREYIDFFFVAIFGATFSFLGAGLIFLTEKEKIKGKLRKFLILTGISAVGLVTGSILHNLFYGLGEMTGDIVVLNFLAQTLHIMFFIIAVLICPFAFLVGTASSIVLFFKEKRGKKQKKK